MLLVFSIDASLGKDLCSCSYHFFNFFFLCCSLFFHLFLLFSLFTNVVCVSKELLLMQALRGLN